MFQGPVRSTIFQGDVYEGFGSSRITTSNGVEACPATTAWVEGARASDHARVSSHALAGRSLPSHRHPCQSTLGMRCTVVEAASIDLGRQLSTRVLPRRHSQHCVAFRCSARERHSRRDELCSSPLTRLRGGRVERHSPAHTHTHTQ